MRKRHSKSLGFRDSLAPTGIQQKVRTLSFETVIGLELHAQLATTSKIFSSASTTFGAEPNAQANAIDLGLPGVLPVLNEGVVRMAVMFGLAIDATIAPRSVFERKNYFYPDLPKGYQISQFQLPIVSGGHVDIEVQGSTKRVRVTRAHLEEDAGKSLHELDERRTAIDLNRAGTPLIEIVSEPELSSASEAVAYMRAVHEIVRYLKICDGNMQEGSFRCDANVSVRRVGDSELGTRTEVKNLNSFRFVERAINFERDRHIEILQSGGSIVQETRLYDPDLDETRSMRGKEEANDYRYFPDPDLLPVLIEADYIEEIRTTLPELGEARRARFVVDYGLHDDTARMLTSSPALADYYEDIVRLNNAHAKLAGTWVTGELASVMNAAGTDITTPPVSSAQLAGLLTRIHDGTVSGPLAKQVFEAMCHGEGNADEIIDAKGLRQVTDTDELEALVAKVIEENPAQLEQYRAGKTKVFGFFVGQAMKASKGKANPAQINALLKRVLDADG